MRACNLLQSPRLRQASKQGNETETTTHLESVVWRGHNLFGFSEVP